MPHGRAHTDQAIVKIGPYAVIVGGSGQRYSYSDLIQVYDTQADRWRSAGRLPYAMKSNVIHHNGWLFAMVGQRSKSPADPAPGEVLRSVWRAKFDPAQTEDINRVEMCSTSAIGG